MHRSVKIEVIREGLRRFNRYAGVLKSDPYGLGLSLSQSSALVDIERFEPLPTRDLVNRLHLEKSSVSRLIAVLKQRRFVRVQGDARDARVKLLSLTAAGRRAVAVIHEKSDASVRAALRHLTPHEQDALAAAFASLAKAVADAT